MLFDELDKARRRTIMTTIVFVFVGIAFLVVPERYLSFVGSACAFAMVVWSVVSILEFAVGPKVLIRYLGLFVALAIGLLGVALFVFDGLFLKLVTGLVAAIPIFGGILGSYHALVFARRSGRRGWWVPLVLSLPLIGFGTMTIINPWAHSTRAVLQLIGYTLAYSAVVYALLLVWMWPARGEEEE